MKSLMRMVTNYKSLVVSAPAKVILHGEHAVVYGKASLAASVDLRTNLTWERLDGSRVDLDFQDLECFMSWSIEEIKNIQLSPDVDMDTFKAFLGSSDVSPVALMAIRTFIYLYQSIYGQMQSFVPGKFNLKSEVPVGAGLGSSAAYCTVLATTMLITSGILEPSAIMMPMQDCCANECLKTISDWAYKAETIIHGKPSGIDNTVSTFGGFLQFQAGKLENINSVPELRILVVNTNIPRSTKAMVTGLRERFDEMPVMFEHLFSAIHEITLECRRVLELWGSQEGAMDRGYFNKLEKLLDLNQDILRTIGVSHPVIDKICEKTLSCGLHSKLTGAGGGGCVISLLKYNVDDNELEKLINELQHLGCRSWKTKLGCKGIVVKDWIVDGEGC
ncbi:mevalonate kinase-like isoform X2 [Xenia sp. Carnegie-2017]|uniref:mevalonate kinase-like isoform X2 n=1 Tax=Xenia sp. Carnegie-2017 TaxID=2897299 RepID=UPI001F04834D|nr:mevalonate kinase-like isoform X2 [Xenia sp. Carnegie-2017]